MIWSGEKHAQEQNLIWCILMALRPNLLLTVYRNTLYVLDLIDGELFMNCTACNPTDTDVVFYNYITNQ